MAVVKCASGHYYDDSKFPSCPHCQKQQANPSIPDSTKTVAKYPTPNVGGNIPTTPIFEPAANDGTGKTQSIYFKNNNANPVSGWLVCVKGENKGRAFDVHVGKNFVGRAMHSDVVINDPQISRENHFSIIYDPNSSQFFISCGASIVYLNSKLLDHASPLNENDVISAGSSDFVFIPYCNKERNWND